MASNVYVVFPGPLWLVVTSPFGMRNGRLHRGTDYGSPTPPNPAVHNSEVIAPMDGVVTNGNEPAGAGIYTWVANGNVLFKAFHLMRHTVPSGSFVRAGTVIGRADNTGASQGDHDHWETWIDGVPVNGQPFYEAARGGTVPIPPTPPPPTPVPPSEEDELMGAREDIIGKIDERFTETETRLNEVQAANDARIQELRTELGIWEQQQTTVTINGVETRLRQPVAYAGWASRPYLVGVTGEPAVYDLRRSDNPSGWELVHIQHPDPAHRDVAGNQAWLAAVIQTNANPDVQWFNPDQPANEGDDALQVAALRALPGYVGV